MWSLLLLRAWSLFKSDFISYKLVLLNSNWLSERTYQISVQEAMDEAKKDRNRSLHPQFQIPVGVTKLFHTCTDKIWKTFPAFHSRVYKQLYQSEVGSTFSYIFCMYVHPDLNSVIVFQNEMWERSILAGIRPWKILLE